MKTVTRVLIALVVLLVLAVIGSSLYLKVYGKAMLEKELSRSLKQPVQIGAVSYWFPFGIRAENVKVGEETSAARVLAQVAPVSLWQKPMHILHLIVHKGIWRYANEEGDRPLKFQVEDIAVDARDILVPMDSIQTAFHLTGRLAKFKNPLSGSRVEGSGWVNLGKKDMDAVVDVIDADGRAGLTAHAVSKNNTMDVTGNVKLNAASAAPASKEGSSVNDLIFGAMASMGVQFGAEFAFQTKMDDFKISNLSFTGSVATNDLPKFLKQGAPALP